MPTTPLHEDDFALFGLSAETATPTALKSAFYEMALLCHPSRGGSEDQMHAVVEAYERVLLALVPSDSIDAIRQRLNRKAQPPSADDTDGDTPSATKQWSLPHFMDIFDETHSQFNSRFNAMFESHQQHSISSSTEPNQIDATSPPQPSNIDGKDLLSTFGCSSGRH